jgi:hypothetical protein
MLNEGLFDGRHCHLLDDGPLLDTPGVVAPTTSTFPEQLPAESHSCVERAMVWFGASFKAGTRQSPMRDTVLHFGE